MSSSNAVAEAEHFVSVAESLLNHHNSALSALEAAQDATDAQRAEAQAARREAEKRLAAARETLRQREVHDVEQSIRIQREIEAYQAANAELEAAKQQERRLADEAERQRIEALRLEYMTANTGWVEHQCALARRYEAEKADLNVLTRNRAWREIFGCEPPPDELWTVKAPWDFVVSLWGLKIRILTNGDQPGIQILADKSTPNVRQDLLTQITDGGNMFHGQTWRFGEMLLARRDVLDYVNSLVQGTA